ncbi:MAG TPA: sialate O-acetylesterase [Candidatus Methylacidiphilales bacterium]
MAAAGLAGWLLIHAAGGSACGEPAPDAEPASVPAPVSVPLWPEGRMPGEKTAEPEQPMPAKNDGVTRITHVSEPSLTFYPAGKALSPAILVCPGGAYEYVVIDKEGSEIARWLNGLGLHAAVLKYRVPSNRNGALQDLERAMRLVRARAREWNVDETKLGVMGFSAGGHLCAALAAKYRTPAYAALDAADLLSCRPDFVSLIYPAFLARNGQVSPEVAFADEVPPIFIAGTEDDKSFMSGAPLYEAALTAAHMPHAFTLFADGGHGYGLRSNKGAKEWPGRYREWLAGMNVLPSSTPGKEAIDAASPSYSVRDGEHPWADKPQWTFESIPDSIRGSGPFPQQKAADGKLTIPGHPAAILVGIAEADLATFEGLPYAATKTSETFNMKDASGAVIPYLVYRAPNPPASIGEGLGAAPLLLKIESSPPSAEKKAPPKPADFAIGEPARFDIYLLMGQSNMLGRDTQGIEAQTPDPRVGALSPEGRWRVAVEPIGAGGTGFGPGTFFAAAMLKAHPERRIGLVQCAVGGTPLSRWVQGADLYENALKRARTAMQSGGTLRGVLWHQGESDSNNPQLADSYHDRLKAMFENLRGDLGMPELPIVVGQLGDFVRGSGVETVRIALRTLPSEMAKVGYADAQGLSHKGDHLHFNVDAQREMGARFASAMQSLQSGTPEAPVLPNVAK